jgi:ribosome biogenesis GTPase / thiamine phosphate phosphatase
VPDPAHPLLPYGWSDRVAALLADDLAVGGEPARVVRVDRGWAQVEAAGGRRSVELDATDDTTIAAGDWVVLDDTGIASIATRWSALERRDPGERVEAQVVATNIDVVVLVHPLDRSFRPRRLERELVLVWESGATPLVALTKSDLADDVDAVTAEAASVAPGVDVIVTSATTGDGVEAVRAHIGPGTTAAVIGPSGAGKSTLINALVGGEVQATAAVREGDARGRHTTTARHLVPLPDGGVLLDTPGMRSVALWASDEGLAMAFPEIDTLAEQCRFRDCRHDQEPGCAVQAAVSAGELDHARLRSWRRLQDELDDTTAARLERARKARTFQRAVRNIPWRP